MYSSVNNAARFSPVFGPKMRITLPFRVNPLNSGIVETEGVHAPGFIVGARL
jgi:hypothetical protein